ncbi:Long-chain-fatty-acid--CoA ligase FadD13 [Nocardioides dokdonensis FR1436]|uniref:Long-chain-fatty-acid--CoA ligase FadD13 n=1 Tax=Nocardioides dokdonensis FR1436 TaxID=1300347 RepID=A0A1A9GKW7_9ACTN|nr:class I adenylate-forming enzyme family protein [Nocardioides dokdonensis]ANH38987.1 Long-chain-fatty-acid--CoA ligase FadD13 [Nocardioides dokdonensis FR1436]
MTLARNVFGILDRSAESSYGARAAVGFEGRTRTFVELRDAALGFAGGMHDLGVRPGDKVAVMMGNRLEWLEVFFGLSALGAVCVPVNVLLTGPEIDHVCRDSGARHLVMDEIASRSVAALDVDFETVVVVGDASAPRHARTAAYPDVVGGRLPADHVGPALDDVFILYYSSGTTGLPKAATHTHDGVLWNAIGQVQGLSLTPQVRYAVIPSFSWAAGFHNLVLGLVWIGGYSEVRRTGGMTVQSIVEGVEHDRITHVMLVPSLLRELVSHPELMERLSASALEWIVTGAEPVPRAVIEGVCRGIPDVDVCQGYGLSEFPTIATVLMADEVFDHEGSAGRALPHTDLAIRAADGEIRRRGTGELLVRSLATMVGYHERPDQTAEAFRDGWLHTGDLVELDADGFITIVGRTKDMIISGGLNLYPREIEDVITALPGVVEAAVVGVPHERFGETAVAVVVTDDPDFDSAVVESACAAQLASYKRPRVTIVRTEPLPRNANSKLLKRELRPWAVEQLDARPEN